MVRLQNWLRGARFVSGRLAMVGVLLAAIVLLFSACGGSSHGTPSGTPVPTTSATGFCPNGHTSQDITPGAVIVSAATPGDSASASVGQTVVVELPATNMRWSTKGVSPESALTQEQPSNALDAALNRCFWTYRATASGTVHLTYIGAPQCNPTQYCPEAKPSYFSPPSPGAGTATPGAPSITVTPAHAIQIVFTIQIA